jgi:hypothetical protein
MMSLKSNSVAKEEMGKRASKLSGYQGDYSDHSGACYCITRLRGNKWLAINLMLQHMPEEVNALVFRMLRMSEVCK